MEDFTKNFEDVDICCLSPDFLDNSSKCIWTTTLYNSSWESGTTAGGCVNNKGGSYINVYGEGEGGGGLHTSMNALLI